MGTATFIKQLTGWKGDARLYRLSGDGRLAGREHVVVSAVGVLGMPETYIFESDNGGNVAELDELPGSFKGDVDHVGALALAGYTVEAAQ